MTKMVVRIMALCMLTFGMFVLGAGCGRDPEAVCEDFCAKFEECSPGTACTCNTKKSDGSTCANEDAILDHIDGCTGDTCGNLVSCITKTPACE